MRQLLTASFSFHLHTHSCENLNIFWKNLNFEKFLGFLCDVFKWDELTNIW